MSTIPRCRSWRNQAVISVSRFGAGVVLVASLWGAPAFGADCNLNGRDDADDLAAASSEDCNQSGVPDECEEFPLAFSLRADSVSVREEIQAIVSADLNGDGLADAVTGSQAGDRSSELSVLLVQADGSFQEPVVYPAATRLSSVAAADLDADGDVDLVSAHSDVLLVFENSGAGGLAAPKELVVSRFTRFVLATDLSGDGVPELVTTNTTDDTLTVLPGLGNLEFAAAVPTVVGERPGPVVAGDLNGDGDPDLVVVNLDSLQLSVLLNLGAGALASPVHHSTEVRPTSAHTGDFDGDGTIDVLCDRSIGPLFFPGVGDGTLASPRALPIPSRGLATVDLDVDGDLDFIAAAADARSLNLFSNDGSGRFGVAGTFNSTLDSHTTGDVDGDGDPDIIFGLAARDGVQVLLNGAVGIALEVEEIPVEAPHDIVVRDFDGDGNPDLATPDGCTGKVSVFLNAGEGSFPGADVYPFTTEGHLFSISAADLDNDGDVDLVSPDRVLNRVGVLLNRGDGKFELPAMQYETIGPAYVSALGDLDGDGFSDVATSASSADAVTAYFNDGQGGLERRIDLSAGVFCWSITTGDLDGDGDLDLLTANANSLDLSFFENRGGGQFAEEVRVPAPASPHFLLTADLDKDGDLDAVSAGEDLVLYFNDGAGNLSGSRSSAAAGAYSVNVADVNLDGNVDLLSSHWRAGGKGFFRLLLGGGDGSFSNPLEFAAGEFPKFAEVADIDLDGDMDIVAPDRSRHVISLFRNQHSRLPSRDPFLGSICTPADFHGLSATSGMTTFGRSTRFVVPASTAPGAPPTPLAGPLFVNVRRFESSLDLLREVFPDTFGDVDAGTYAGLVERRESREYFAGEIRRQPHAGRMVYGLDIQFDVEDAAEVPTLDEVRSVYDAVSAAFLLEPLGYAPRQAAAREVAAAWEEPGMPLFLSEPEPPIEPEPEPGPGPAPTFELRVPDGFEVCGVFGPATTDRGIREEHVLKSHVRLRGGTIALPTDAETFEATLFEEVRFGPALQLAEPVATGAFTVRAVPGSEGLITYRFTYEQAYVLPDGRSLELGLVTPLQLGARGELLVDGAFAFNEMFVTALAGREPFLARLDGEPMVRYGSCAYEALALVEVEAVFEDGTTLRLKERFEEAGSEFDTAPVGFIRAEVVIGGQQRTVTDYERLVYSALRHNRAPVYWVLFETPVRLPGVDGDIHGVELSTESPPVQPQGAYLNAELQPLLTAGVRSLTREDIPETPDGRFLRGDANSDGNRDVGDAIFLLDHIFRRGEEPPCRKAGDVDDDGRINIVDPMLLVSGLFRSQEAGAGRLGPCARDGTVDTLTCARVGCP